MVLHLVTVVLNSDGVQKNVRRNGKKSLWKMKRDVLALKARMWVIGNDLTISIDLLGHDV